MIGRIAFGKLSGENDVASKAKGPQFIRFLRPIIEVLRESGGSATSSEVADKVIERMNIPDEEQSIILKSGQSRIYNQVHWGRMYLVNGGILDSSKRGIWKLTEEGSRIDLEKFDALTLFKAVQKQHAAKRATDAETSPERALCFILCQSRRECYLLWVGDKRPSKRMAKWLRASFQWRMGRVHLRLASRMAM